MDTEKIKVLEPKKNIKINTISKWQDSKRPFNFLRTKKRRKQADKSRKINRQK